MKLHTLRYTDEEWQTNRLYIMQHPDFSATVVDPASATEALTFLEENECNLAAIVLTHHHVDHTAGVKELLEHYPDCPVVAGDGVQKRVPQVNHILADGHQITIGDTRLKAIATPGHTLDHYVFHTHNGVLFAGDCLFRFGCGRLFDGTPDMMWTSLLRLRALPDATVVCAGHDYTIDNARFSLSNMPNDVALMAAVQQLTELSPDTRMPFLLSEDKASNLFLRADEPEVMAITKSTNGRDSFAALRRKRDLL